MASADQGDASGRLTLRSPAFDDGTAIPREYGYTKQNISPPLEIEGVPAEAKSLALVMDDPDAMKPAGQVWDHWTVWNIDPGTSEIAEGDSPPGAVEGTNSYGSRGYGGPNPPDGEHAYRFVLYALDTELSLESGATKSHLERAIDGHVLGEARLTGTYAP
ncbi:YbhB/YbcL family Raf kinase inhibitor-like protein [Haloferax sp. MBLA0076]|uniref:YbhB/YbcL family Raf kinase inhibitor-like protein n=1 Tax=Haloferax litoreum TaxID=2666140 RepID=A0A6A8GDP5_9EURY|nr:MULTISPECIES: YbhB/YbcL family Raf kinase inhibitor-like protein [Haloferax]KAB1192518.1 YbhB/YbcL family Raf kinase inhibitor-like protein [Haloferax sp. CBA1148]MRX20989.1 YbhB/YbcL family Raf kinase inhibitor-like protein [Haloferax litoreum]